MLSHMELSDQEHEILREVLDSALKELEVEIRRTDTLDFKESLKHRSEVLRSILSKIGQPMHV